MLSQVVEHMPSKSQAPSWHEITATKFASGKINVVCTCAWGRYNSPMTKKNACYHGKKVLQVFGPHLPRSPLSTISEISDPPEMNLEPTNLVPTTSEKEVVEDEPKQAGETNTLPDPEESNGFPLTKVLFGIASTVASIGIIFILKRRFR